MQAIKCQETAIVKESLLICINNYCTNYDCTADRSSHDNNSSAHHNLSGDNNVAADNHDIDYNFNYYIAADHYNKHHHDRRSARHNNDGRPND